MTANPVSYTHLDVYKRQRVANASSYVCLADYTHKADYTLINELSEQKKLPNLCTLINGLDMKKKKYGYY